MSLVTIRILDGPDRGKSFHRIATPVTIGREEGNYVQLNDERVSRYHLKIHENNGSVLLTDLQSTNGTRVNGEDVQVWALRPGDIISLGRTLLIFGSTDEIGSRLHRVSKGSNSRCVQMGVEGEEFSFLNKTFEKIAKGDKSASLFELEIFRGLSPEELEPLHLLAIPEMPKKLTPLQTAQLTELLQYIFLRLRYLILSAKSISAQNSSVKTDSANVIAKESAAVPQILFDNSEWQNLLDFYEKIGQLLKNGTE
ncbi:peptide-binding protein [Planctomycetales bacterium]|nr:peptide-binding protein [Planctomycetales bacterium]